MIIQLDKRNGVAIYRQVMEQVTRAIISGQLSVGEQLESVGELSKRLKVNPMTISKAYGFLVEQDLVERRPGIGLFIHDVPKQQRQKAQTELLTKAMDKAAALAIELGLDETRAVKLFTERVEENISLRQEEK